MIPRRLVLAGLVVAVSACGKVPDHAGGAALDSASCWQCHGDRYLAATSPNHVASGLPQTCESCHSTLAWQPAEAGDHDRYWPLTGQHVVAPCASCHVDDVYGGTPRECIGCHRDDFVATTNPDHEAGNYPEACEGCHSTTAWRPASFAHDAFWPLVGKHTTTTCASCHEGEVYAGTPRACEGCHLDDYQATTSPNHTSAALPTACAGCHTAYGWVPADFGAHDQYWPLAGKHALAACTSCHEGGVYAGTPRVCVGCHQGDYDRTTAPAHLTAGFPTTCETCHGVDAWVPSSFDHQATWPLRGQHLVAACASCHGGGVYAGTPRLCYGCHAPDYQAADNPSHVDLALATTCEGCHDESAWATNRFPVHDPFFPITTGKHRGYGCDDCHTNPTEDWTLFTCTGCHEGEHQLARMNLKHGDVTGYTQAVTTYGVERACLHCHPDGRED